MELAALRTRRPKRDAKLGELIDHWQAEAKALGFELSRSSEHIHTISCGRSHAAVSVGRDQTPSLVRPASAPTAFAAAAPGDHQSATQLGSRLAQVLRALDQPARMSGVRVKLRYLEYEKD
jgi:hypothetical protein